MCSQFGHDQLTPQLFERMEILMRRKVPPAVEEEPRDGEDNARFTFLANRLRELERSSRRAFQLFLNAHQFDSRDISVRIEGGHHIVIQAKHEGMGACREFTTRCRIPEHVDPASLGATLNKNGLLVVRVKVERGTDSSPEGEVAIPVEMQEQQTA